ncbi:hypothetical protein Tco_0128355, partial [Tanacetum coccineum]
KQKKAFNGQQEFLQALIPMTEEQIYNEVKHIENKWGKGKRTNNNASENQEDTRGRGEKNVVESIVRTLLHIPGKTKDGLNARLDLAELGVKPKLFAMQDEDKTTLPLADEYKDNGRIWGLKLGCNESDVKPFWKDIEKAKACMLAKAQASEVSSKAKVEACGSKAKVEAGGSNAKLQASTKTLIVKSPVPITNCVLGLANAKTWDAIKGKTFGVKIPPTMTCAEEKIGKRNLRSGKHKAARFSLLADLWVIGFSLLADLWVIVLSLFPELAELGVSLLAELADLGHGPSIPRILVYEPTIQGLLDNYGYDNIEDYLSDCYFPSTDKEDTIVHTGQDLIHECHSLKSKAKYVSVSQKHNQNVKSPIAITGCVLGLPNVNTWDDILKKFGMRTYGRCADKWMNGKDYGKNNHHVFCIYSSDDSKGVSSKGPSITSISKEGSSIARLSKEPILKELLAWYGYDIVEDYLPVTKKPIPKKFGMRSPGRCADKSKGKRKISSNSSYDRKGASKVSALIFYGPSTRGLLDAYGFNTIEEYLSWSYFPSTNNESTNMETTDKGNTDKDCIDDSNSAMSKGKYVPVCKKHNPNMYSPVPVTGCVLGLANVTTWDEIEKKIGARKSKTYVDKAKGKRKVSCGS